MNKYLFNPFRYIAGWEAFGAGIFVLFATSAIGCYSHVHLPDLISVKTTPGLPFYVLLIQNLSNWLVPSLLFYLSALFFSKSEVRAIDVFGTQALARFPYLLAVLTGFSGALNKFGSYMLWYGLRIGEEVQITSLEITFAVVLILFTTLLTVWIVALQFNAYKTSTNLKGAKLIVSFVVIIVASIAITGILSNYLLHTLFP
jgi:hypothetical protein